MILTQKNKENIPRRFHALDDLPNLPKLDSHSLKNHTSPEFLNFTSPQLDLFLTSLGFLLR